MAAILPFEKKPKKPMSTDNIKEQEGEQNQNSQFEEEKGKIDQEAVQAELNLKRKPLT